MDRHLERLASRWFLSPPGPGNRKGGARPSDGRHPHIGTFQSLWNGATRSVGRGPIRWMTDVHPPPHIRENGATRSPGYPGKVGRSTVGTPYRETGATRMYRSGGSDGRNRFPAKTPGRNWGQPLFRPEAGTWKHHAPDGSRSSSGTGQPDPPDVTTRIQGPTK